MPRRMVAFLSIAAINEINQNEYLNRDIKYLARMWLNSRLNFPGAETKISVCTKWGLHLPPTSQIGGFCKEPQGLLNGLLSTLLRTY